MNMTPLKLKQLKRSYKKAVDGGQTQFTFEGKEFLVSYAKYLIEYLDGRFIEHDTN